METRSLKNGIVGRGIVMVRVGRAGLGSFVEEGTGFEAVRS